MARPQKGKRGRWGRAAAASARWCPSFDGSVRRVTARRMCCAAEDMSDVIETFSACASAPFCCMAILAFILANARRLPRRPYIRLYRCTRARTQGASLAFIFCSRLLVAGHTELHLFRSISSVRDGPGGRSAVDHVRRAAQQEREGSGQVHHIHGTYAYETCLYPALALRWVTCRAQRASLRSPLRFP